MKFNVGDIVERIAEAYGVTEKGGFYTIRSIKDEFNICLMEDDVVSGYSVFKFRLAHTNKSFQELTNELTKLIG